MLSDGTLNVVNEDDPPFVPVIIPSKAVDEAGGDVGRDEAQDRRALWNRTLSSKPATLISKPAE
jgi:hypothetical protein